MKASSVIAVIALTAGLAFIQAPAQARPVSKSSISYGISPIFRNTKVRACFIGKKLIVPCPKPAPKAKPGYLTFR